ncbi:MAG: hypothetical protein ABEJ26_10585 [Halosimplex sp.]
MQNLTRRTALRAGVGALLGSLAGCSALPTDSSEPDDLTFERLDATAVYVADGVELSLPAEIQTVEATNNADLLLLSDEPDADAERAVEWLADDRVLALLGDGAEATWLSWARSDAFRDAFGDDGIADSEPDPWLLVGAAIGTAVKTYRNSWSDGPRDRDVLRALDERLAAIERETPSGA